jgi:phage shock protein E
MASLFSSLFSLFGCAQPADSTVRVKEMLAGGEYVIVDVRTPEEFAEGHNEGAVNKPLQDIEKWKASLMPSKRNIILVCRSGRRADTALHILEKAGYANVVNAGGWETLEKIMAAAKPK